MSPDKTKQLVEKFPKIFSLIINPDPPPNMPISLFSFECDDGWYNLIYSLCSNIQWYIDYNRKDRLNALKYNRLYKRALKNNDPSILAAYYAAYTPEEKRLEMATEDLSKNALRKVPEKIRQVVAVQVKEKFGTLRFYTNGGDDYTDGMITFAESFSGKICEVCGNVGERSDGGWVTTRCSEHAT